MNQATSKTETSVSDPLAGLYDQEVRKLVTQNGLFMVGAVERWEMEGKSGDAGFIQIAIPQSDDSKALTLMRIKVPESRFGTIDILNKTKRFQVVQLQIEVRESFKKVQYVMTEEQPFLKSE